MIFVFALFVLTGHGIFPQSTNEWKNKTLYAGSWLGYGSGFSLGIQADMQFFKHFSVGLEAGLADKAYPAVSFFPKAVFRPGEMELTLFAGPCFGYNAIYGGFVGLVYGFDAGFHLGPGILYATVRNGAGYAFGIGYRIGFADRKRGQYADTRR
jgi:hypothetical protein